MTLKCAGFCAFILFWDYLNIFDCLFKGEKEEQIPAVTKLRVVFTQLLFY